MRLNKMKIYLMAMIILSVLLGVIYIFFIPKNHKEVSKPLLLSLKEFQPSEGEDYCLAATYRLPEYSDNTFLFIRNYYQNHHIYIGETLLYDIVEIDKKPLIFNHVLPLPREYSGAVMNVYTDTPWDYFRDWSSEIYIAHPEALIVNLFKDSAVTFYLAIISTVGGIILIFCVIFSFDRRNLWHFISFGIFIISYAIFSISRLEIFAYILPPVSAANIPILLHAVYLIPFLFFVKTYFNHFVKLLWVNIIVMLLHSVIVLWLFFFNPHFLVQIIDYSDKVVLFTLINTAFVYIVEVIKKNKLAVFALPSGILVVITGLSTFIGDFYKNKMIQNLYLFSVYFMIIVIFLYLVSTYLENRNQEKIEKTYLSVRGKAAQVHYDEIASNISNIKKIKHDMKNHLLVLSLMLDEKRYEQSNAYIDEIVKKINSQDLIYSGNMVVDTIIAYKRECARENDIYFSFILKVPPKLPVQDTDFSSILLNVLDNAFEAVTKLSMEEREINIEIKVRNHFLIITCSNSYLSSGINEGFLSTKDEPGHGLGLKIIEQIVKKYNGLTSVEKADNIFTIIMMLPIME